LGSLHCYLKEKEVLMALNSMNTKISRPRPTTKSKPVTTSKSRSGSSAAAPTASEPRGAFVPKSGRASAPASTAVSPSSKGPYEVEEIRTTLVRNGRSIPVVAEVPKGASPMPAMVFLPGFKIDSQSYAQTTKYLASHGFVVIRADPPGGLLSANHEEMSLDASAAIDWAADAKGQLQGKVDITKIGVAGHSMGGKLATMTAIRDSRVKALFAIDPVNLRDPDVVGSSIKDLKVPFGLVGETTDAVGPFLRPAVAPKEANYQTFFEGSNNAPWVKEWTLEGADHFDFVDDGGGALAALTSNGGSADSDKVLQTTRSLLTAFARQHLKGEDMSSFFREKMPVDVSTRNRG
jgi:pimeloyl-ACP methyl ester carboxylesterase